MRGSMARPMLHDSRRALTPLLSNGFLYRKCYARWLPCHENVTHPVAEWLSPQNQVKRMVAFGVAGRRILLRALGVLNDGDRLDLDEHLRLSHRRLLDHRGRGADHAERLAMGPRSFFETRDIDQVNARSYDVVERGAGLDKRLLDVRDRLFRLSIDISLAY